MLTLVAGHATGDLLPAADWNTYVKDNLNWLIAAGANIGGSGTLIPTNEFHIVTGATTLDTIAPVSPVAGQRLRLLFQNSLLIRHNGGGIGNIRFVGGADRYTQPNQIITFSYDGTNWWAADSASATAYSSAFDVVSTNALTTIFTQSIPGGLLGLLGALDIWIEADYFNNTGAARNLAIQISYGGTTLWGHSMGGAGIGASVAGHRAFQLRGLLSNENATNLQRIAGFAGMSDLNAGSIAGWGAIDGGDVVYGTFGGSAAVDSTVAQTLLVQVQHSASSANLELKGTVHVAYRP